MSCSALLRPQSLSPPLPLQLPRLDNAVVLHFRFPSIRICHLCRFHDMDPLSVTASIIAVLQLSAKVLEYLSDVRDAPKERSHCEAEISNLSALLRALRDHVQTRDLSQPWYTAIAELAAPKGPFDQFKQALEALQNKITDGGRLKKLGEALVWKFKKEEIAGILDRIERLKSLVEIVLQMDHL
jgi:hypothetical protein